LPGWSRSLHGPDAWALRVLFALALLLRAARPCSGQPASAPAPTRSLTVSYADGRVTTHPIERAGEWWTPLFPRVAGPVPSRGGQALSALAVSYQTEGEVLVATVSLLYGSPHRVRVKVATLTVSAAPAAVNELRAYGVEPVTLSLAAIAEGTLGTPAVSNVSKALTVTVSPLPPGGSRYRFTIANSSSRTLTAFRFLAYRGSAVAISGMRRGERGEPLVGPGGSATFVLTVGSGSAAGRTPGPPGPLGRIAITFVLWDDGFEGDRDTAEREQRYRAQLKHGLERALPVLRQSTGGLAQELRSRLSDMSADDDPGTRQIANILLTDLSKAVGPLPLDRWLATTIPAYEQWLARLSGRPR
jgi:hypothetical protein